MRAFRRDAIWLMGASVVSGLAAYAYVAVGTRTYGGAFFAPISVLWSLWVPSAALVTFPVQQWIVRSFRVAGGEGEVRSHVLRLFTILSGISVALGVTTWSVRGALFHSDSWLFPALAAGLCFGAGISGFSRGVLAGRGRFRLVACSLAGEHSIRMLAGVVAVVTGASVQVFAACLVLGPLVVLGTPGALRLGRDMTRRSGSVLSGIGGLLTASLFGLLILSTPPVVISALGGTAIAVSSVFAALALFRVPYGLLGSLGTRISHAFVRLVVDGGEDQLQRTLRLVGIAAAGGAVLMALVASVGGEQTLQLVFGGDLRLSRGAAAAIGAGVVFAIGSYVLTLALAARGRAPFAAASGFVALVVGAAVIVLVPSSAVGRALSGFLAAALVRFIALLASASRAATDVSHLEEASSPDEPTGI